MPCSCCIKQRLMLFVEVTVILLSHASMQAVEFPKLATGLRSGHIACTVCANSQLHACCNPALLHLLVGEAHSLSSDFLQGSACHVWRFVWPLQPSALSRSPSPLPLPFSSAPCPAILSLRATTAHSSSGSCLQEGGQQCQLAHISLA